MIGDKLYKCDVDWSEKYTEEAIWCNSNNAHIEDKGSYYEVCENVVPEPTNDEQLAELDAQYQTQKDSLIAEYADALIHGDSEAQELVQTEMTNLDTWYDEEYNKIVGDEEQ